MIRRAVSSRSESDADERQTPIGASWANDNELVRFAAQWAPFGGGDEYIYPEFGLTPEQFYRRVLDVIQTECPSSASALGALCRRKIHASVHGAANRPRR